MGLIAVIALAVVGLWLIKSGRATEIQKSISVREMVMAINHGRIHPYHTGMSLKDVVWAVNHIYPNTSEFKKDLDRWHFLGRVPSIDLPYLPHPYIDRITIGFNRNNVVSSISVYLRDFEKNKEELIIEMTTKFGRPMSSDRQFIIWRERQRVINISNDGSVNVIDENLFGI